MRPPLKFEAGGSRIPGAGRGLFALADLGVGDHIGWYGGRVVPCASESEPGHAGYVLRIRVRPPWIAPAQWRGSTCVAPRAIARLGTHLINHASHRRANARLLANGRVVCARRIRAGDEVTMHYGDDFARRWRAPSRGCGN